MFKKIYVRLSYQNVRGICIKAFIRKRANAQAPLSSCNDLPLAPPSCCTFALRSVNTRMLLKVTVYLVLADVDTALQVFQEKEKITNILKSVMKLSPSDGGDVARMVMLLKPEVNLLCIQFKIRLYPQEIQTLR